MCVSRNLFFNYFNFFIMKHLKIFAALCCVAAALAACEPQNGPDNGQNGNNDQNGDNGTAANTENGYEWIDLGLSVKWATQNVGAVLPEGYGDYFAWGETTTKSSYKGENYKWCNGSWDNFTKYNTSSKYGTVDNKTRLELEDDAARANWGGAWRMPTEKEWTELHDKCAWKWTEDYKGIGVRGYVVTSLTNGNAIFLPAAGYYQSDYLYDGGEEGYYWSSSLSTSNPSKAITREFRSSYVGEGYILRSRGLPVRPVCE